MPLHFILLRSKYKSIVGPLNSLVKANVEYKRIHVAHKDEENKFHSKKNPNLFVRS